MTADVPILRLFCTCKCLQRYLYIVGFKLCHVIFNVCPGIPENQINGSEVFPGKINKLET